MNVAQLQPPTSSQVQRVALEAEDATPDFLSVRLVNKRFRVKLSPEPLNLSSFPSKGQLFTVANTLGWFVAVVNSGEGLALVASPVSDLRSQLVSSDNHSGAAFKPQRTLPLPSITPHYVIFACNDSRLLVGLTEGPVLVFDASSVCTPGSNEVGPIHSFPSTTSTAVRQMYSNPGDIPELVAVLREPDGNPSSQLVEILNVMTLQSSGGWRGGGTSESFPTSMSWSPKGKQIAIGLQSGDIITFSPAETGQAKSFIPRPQGAQNQAVIHTTWLSNPAFYTIYAPPGPLDPQVDQTHMIVSYDGKRNFATDTSLPLSLFPTGVRPPGAFTVVLRNWDPMKILLLVGDSTTADIGIVASVASSPTEDRWQRLSLEDGATPSMPLDNDSQETTMIGLELDLKATDPFGHVTPSGETVDVPPPPIVYAYASDGTIVGWYVINTRGTAYPGILSASPMATANPAPVNQDPAQTPNSFSQPSFGQSSAFKTPAFGQSSTSAFGTPAFGQPALGASGSAFGQAPSSFGQSSGSTFGQPSAFGQSASSPFGQASSSGGFGTFATANPTKFGQSAFNSVPAASLSPPEQIETSESTESMMSTDGGPGFGSLSLGGDSSDTAKSSLGSGGIFGTAASQPAQPAQPAQSNSGFSASRFSLSPGFGAFGNTANSQPKAEPAPASEPPKPSSAFGQTGFGSAPAFGRSGFGQPAFGQPAFGTPGFGTASPMSTTPQASPATANPPSTFGGGGFGSYASGVSSFAAAAKPAADAVPAWKTASDDKPASNASSVFGGGGGFAAYASGGTSMFGSDQKPQQGTPAAPSWKTSDGSAFASGSSAFAGPSASIASPPVNAGSPSTAQPSTPPAKSPFAPGPPAENTQPTPTFASSTTPTSSPAAADVPRMPTSLATPPSPASPPPAAEQSSPTKKSSSSPFGPSRFGNFSAKDSPFANPKPLDDDGGFARAASGSAQQTSLPIPATPGTVFGQPSIITPRQSAFGQPAFGQPSFGQPSFGSPATPATKTTTSSSTPVASVFSAFGGGTTAFGKPSSSGKSFSELLRESGQKEQVGDKGKDKEPTKPSSSVFEAPRMPGSPFGGPKAAPQSAFDPPRSAFGTTTPPSKVPLSSTSGNNDAATSSANSDTDEEDEKPDVKGKGKMPSKPSTEESFGDLSYSSTSATSSFVEIPSDAGHASEDEEEPATPNSDDEQDEGGQDIDDFLSEPYSDREDEDEEEEEEDEEDEGEEGGEASQGDSTDSLEKEKNVDGKSGPAAQSSKATPTPETPSPSPPPTPKPVKPSIRVEVSSPPPSEAKPKFAREQSTTPPGSPSKEANRSPSPLAQPTPVAASPSPSPTLGIGLGRPSTRPLRSSPLASEPVSGGDEGEVKGTARAKSPSPIPQKARPASPKIPFGSWGTSTSPSESKSSPFGESFKAPPTEAAATGSEKPLSPVSSRPKTPPALFGKTPFSTVTPSPTAASASAPAATVTPPPAVGLGSFKPGGFFGKPATPVTPPPATAGPFSLGKTTTIPTTTPTISPPVNSSTLGGGLGKPPGVTVTSPGWRPPVAADLFTPGAKASMTPPGPGLSLGHNAKPTSPPSSTAAPAPPLPKPGEQLLSLEFAHICNFVESELMGLGQAARLAASDTDNLVNPKTPMAFTYDKITRLGKDIKAHVGDLAHLAESRKEDLATIREFESNLLRAKTRKEEIVHFDKAKSDVEFAKMLKTRFLGPEHTELQTKLRRDIEDVNDRITKMEDTLATHKKDLSRVKTGKPGIKPPSIDTINKTVRNIELAIAQQQSEVNALAAHVSKLDLTGRESTLARDKRLREDISRRPLNVTPHVASTTAAALNAEQSAHRLKNALLAAREKPLLNTQATRAPAAPKAFVTPQKQPPAPASGSPPFHRQTEPNHDLSRSSRSRRTLHSKHPPPVLYPRSSVATPKPAAPAFDWGPLPGVPPKATLGADLRSFKKSGS
ncbi:hypothetical protein BV25DRAFT_1918637 [Artomyces pyxidatus]|uniref:Uncharacterized protein n=1 Tax=Artomyces pyxidatus TaxID=48021 RepID=A0ACB8SSF5_9AGAM|nr:hypothetical protein BV25DRAFT_1918637 [Artomyces pyxidatus]